jgi:cytosine deaminase
LVFGPYFSERELDHCGVPVGAASDNVRDYWHPYGDYDPIQNYKGAVTMCHLDSVPNEGYWSKLVTTIPGCTANAANAASKSSSSLFDVGCDADFVVFPNARTASELFGRPNVDHESRCVLRRGKVQTAQLPSYRELDDLNKHRTRIVREKTAAGKTGSIVGMEG